MNDELIATREALQSAPAEEVLRWAEQRFGARAAIASSFGAEDMVLIDLAGAHAPSLRVFTLDTGRLPPETYELMTGPPAATGWRSRRSSPSASGWRRSSPQGYFSFQTEHRGAQGVLRHPQGGAAKRALAGRRRG